MKTDKRSATASATPTGAPAREPSNFRIKRRQVAVYFNNGKCSQTVWIPNYELGVKDEEFVRAVNAARDAFNAIYSPKKKPVEVPEVGHES